MSFDVEVTARIYGTFFCANECTWFSFCTFPVICVQPQPHVNLIAFKVCWTW